MIAIQRRHFATAVVAFLTANAILFTLLSVLHL